MSGIGLHRVLHEIELHVEASVPAPRNRDLEGTALDRLFETLDGVVGEIGALRTGKESHHRRLRIGVVEHILARKLAEVDEAYGSVRRGSRLVDAVGVIDDRNAL